MELRWLARQHHRHMVGMDALIVIAVSSHPIEIGLRCVPVHRFA